MVNGRRELVAAGSLPVDPGRMLAEVGARRVAREPGDRQTLREAGKTETMAAQRRAEIGRAERGRRRGVVTDPLAVAGEQEQVVRLTGMREAEGLRKQGRPGAAGEGIDERRIGGTDDLRERMVL